MKLYKKIGLLCMTSFLVLTCSNESVDSSGSINEPVTEGDYFPNAINNFWNYAVSNTNNETNENFTSSDSLYVVSQNANTFMLDVNNGFPANGTLSAFLASGNLTRSENTLRLNGVLELPDEIASLFDFDIVLENFIFYDAAAQTNTELSLNSNTITQDFNGFPVTIDYALSSKALGNFENLSLNGITYTMITASEITLNISVSTTVSFGGFPITIDILEPQDVLVATNYFANTIGLVQATSQSNYQISDTAIAALETAGQTLPIPTSGSSTNIQNLTTFSLSE